MGLSNVGKTKTELGFRYGAIGLVVLQLAFLIASAAIPNWADYKVSVLKQTVGLYKTCVIEYNGVSGELCERYDGSQPTSLTVAAAMIPIAIIFQFLVGALLILNIRKQAQKFGYAAVALNTLTLAAIMTAIAFFVKAAHQVGSEKFVDNDRNVQDVEMLGYKGGFVLAIMAMLVGFVIEFFVARAAYLSEF
ncbi:uncharacterized protein EV422DRAFT_543651 [Fimicolochytrium jonesii]|uniref:uncharacterized protein n=1 Tax=Fimicolochytrium jonesii TaxID=1396493 RepID=UPI0022FEA8C3|nr:uncharacterized protein EV422DRAFT_543651 [Fimicolochytrium jonesii]KAI8816939.1 hypothetical protein EV422DRAFT_543651 [Fimicolochytrium jonesii]